MALTHPQIWSALDALAARAGLSASGLARAAGLDPTSFNRSKRTSGGSPPRPRWPSTESVAKVLAATGMSFADFAALAEPQAAPALHTVPLLGLAHAGEPGAFNSAGAPDGGIWREALLPGAGGERLYALDITGDSMLPAYRDGDRVLVDPAVAPRPGDRVVLKTLDGEVMAKELGGLTRETLELRALSPEHPDTTLERASVAWMARIVWVSQ